MNIKKFRSIVLCLIVSLLLPCLSPVSAYAASRAENAMKAYRKLLESGSRLEGLSSWNKGVEWSNAKYAFIDVNRDGVSEMLVRSNSSYGMYHTMLVGYVNGKAKCIAHAPIATTTGTGQILVYPSRKMVCLVTYHGSFKFYTYYRCNGKTLDEKCESCELINPAQTHEITYRIGGKEVSKKEYTAYKAKLLNGAKSSKIKWKKTNPGKTNKTAYYSGTSYYFAQLIGGGRKDSITKISYKGNKVTIKGSLIKAPAFGKNGTLLKNRSRTFKMTKYCEYHYADGLCSKNVSKKKFFKNATDCYFFGFGIYTNSKGEVYRMFVDYSM